MRAIIPALLLLLAACGAKGPLAWPQGGPPPAPLGETPPLEAEEMIEPPPQAAPVRLDDPVEDAEERGEDRFDLPPPG